MVPHGCKSNTRAMAAQTGHGSLWRVFFGGAVALLWVGVIAAGPVWAAERMSVKTPLANVRANPDTASDTLWQLEKYHPVLVLEKKGDWFRFADFEGDEGWIHSSLLDSTPTVIVKVPRANIRTGPGTTFSLSFDANKGTPFKVLQKKERWLKVQHADGDVGWIFDALVW